MIQNNRYYWSHLKTKTVTISVQPKAQYMAAIYRVSKVIDLGNGRQTIVLDHAEFPNAVHHRPKKTDVSIPLRAGNLDFIYTSRQNPTIRNVNHLLSYMYEGARIEKIVPDVVCPGDLLVFRQEDAKIKMQMVEALRIVKANPQKESKTGYAV